MHGAGKLALSFLLGLACSLPSSGQAATVYTANEGDHSVSVVNTTTQQHHLINLSVSPHNLDLSADHRRLFVTGMVTGPDAGHSVHEHAAAPGVLDIIDLTIDPPKLISQIPIAGHPAHVVPTTNADQVLVTDSEQNELLKVSTEARKVIERYKTGRFPHGVRVSADGAWAATANMKDGTVTLVDLAQPEKPMSISVGRNPVQVGFFSRHPWLAVSLHDENAVGLVDLSTRKLLRKIKVGRGPVQIFVTPDDQTILVANQGSAKTPDHRLSFIDLGREDQVTFLDVGVGAHGVHISQDGQQAFVTNTQDNSLSVIDLASRTVVATLPTGRSPNGVVSAP